MKRVLLLGLLMGAVNAVAATATVLGLYGFTRDLESFGYSGSAPSGAAGGAYGSTVDFYFDVSPWEYVALPAVLIVLNALLLPLVVSCGWLRQR